MQESQSISIPEAARQPAPVIKGVGSKAGSAPVTTENASSLAKLRTPSSQLPALLAEAQLLNAQLALIPSGAARVAAWSVVDSFDPAQFVNR